MTIGMTNCDVFDNLKWNYIVVMGTNSYCCPSNATFALVINAETNSFHNVDFKDNGHKKQKYVWRS